VRHCLFDANSAASGSGIYDDRCPMLFDANALNQNNTPGSLGGTLNITRPPDGVSPLVTSNNFVGNNSVAIYNGGVLGRLDGGGNYLLDNNGADGMDTTACPRGSVDDLDDSNSDSEPKQFMFVDACRAMATVANADAGPAGP